MPEIANRTAGLCSTCRHMRPVPHPRGGVPYVQCGLSESDSRFPRYPRLPVLQCSGYALRDADNEGSGELQS